MSPKTAHVLVLFLSIFGWICAIGAIIVDFTGKSTPLAYVFDPAKTNFHVLLGCFTEVLYQLLIEIEKNKGNKKP